MNEIEHKTTAMVFEQQPEEGNKAFAAFKLYLDLGPERTVAQVAEKLGRTPRTLWKWSRQFDWIARVRAHAAYRSELERKAIEGRAVERAVEWEKTHEPTKRLAWLKAEELLALADDFLERWRGTEELPGFHSVVRGIELAFKLKQFASGLPSETREVNTNVTGKIDVEWDLAIKKAYARKAEAAAPVVDVEPVNPESTQTLPPPSTSSSSSSSSPSSPKS